MIDDSVKELLKDKISKLSIENPVILLEPMDNESINLIERLLKNNENIKTFTIGKQGKEQRMFLKIHPFNQDEAICEALEREASKFYNKSEYLQALNKYLEIIMISSNPKPPYYRMLAYTYLHLDEIDKAVMYFRIAEGRSLRTKNKYRFDNLINKISKK